MSELRRVSAGIMIAFMLVALTATYWSVIGADSLRQREENPRRVLAEAVLRRGAIYDRQGMLLATTAANYNGSGLRRLYPHPEVAPAVGYYSPRFGVSGVEATYDALLRGAIGPTPLETAARELLHQPATGGDVRLTLDLHVQRAAAEAIGDQTGAIIVATLPDGAIRAMVSAPIFNPNVLDEDWDILVGAPDAPLLNRVTQGIYQPGGVLQTVLLGAAITYHVPTDTAVPNSTMPVQANGLRLTCARTPPPRSLTLGEAYAYACPGAFAQIIGQLSPEIIDQAFWRSGLLTRPDLLGLNTEMADSPLPLTFLRDEEAVTAALVGQGGLTITPLQALDVIAAVANGGNVPRYHLVDAIRLPGADAWEPVQPTGLPRAVLTRQAAEELQQIMQLATTEGAAAAAQAASEYPVWGHTATAFSGPGAKPLQWFIGMTRLDDEQAVVVVVVIEDSEVPQQAARIGGYALDAAARAYGPPPLTP